MLLPTATGYSFIQIMILSIAMWGVGFANSTYQAGIRAGLFGAQGLDAVTGTPVASHGLRDMAKNYVKVRYCSNVLNTFYEDAKVDFVRGTGKRPVRDLYKQVGNRIEDVYYIEDRNKDTKVGDGKPVCGGVSLVRYLPTIDNIWPIPSGVSLGRQMNKLRYVIQNEKNIATKKVMKELDDWVASWPVLGPGGKVMNMGIQAINWVTSFLTSNPDKQIDVKPDLDSVDAKEFNRIVSRHEKQLDLRVRDQLRGMDHVFDKEMTILASALTKDGWSMAGGWFQKVGLVRGHITKSISEPMAYVSEPRMVHLPHNTTGNSARITMLAGIDGVIERAENANSKNKEDRLATSSASSLIPDDMTTVSVTNLRRDLDNQMSATTANMMRYVVTTFVGEGDR